MDMFQKIMVTAVREKAELKNDTILKSKTPFESNVCPRSVSSRWSF